MVLHIDSDASYLSLLRERSRTTGYHFLSDRPGNISKSSTEIPTPNGPIIVIVQSLECVASFAADAELEGIFENCVNGIPERQRLEKLNHPQPSTPLKTNNSTANGFANNRIKKFDQD